MYDLLFRMKQVVIILSVLLLFGCAKQQPAHRSAEIHKAAFVADSAYQYVAEQVAFGPRIIGSDAHKYCVDYLSAKLQQFGAVVSVQQGEMLDYADKQTPVANIIGRYNPDAKNRILLAAHYDSRPWADHDANSENHYMPIDGANDGASGVGVLLEIARQLQQINTDKGIDIVFFDAEDMGAPEFYTGKEKKDDWCLGSQFWAKQCKANNFDRDYQFGIVLDMIGGGDAVFPHEYFSVQYANEYVSQIWQTAIRLGYNCYFIDEVSYPITDDHYYVNTLAGIPCVDIIHYANPRDYGDSGFCEAWHTVNDNMQVINKNTLDVVGTTVLTYINNL